ncbi:MAG TPA: MBL fold metallo-hydrolase [Anaerolineales bacterium]|nr:MBL fold metallo-hydrolase [Anaerolineales bacterium]
MALINYERVSENVYSFQSENYAQVTAGIVEGPNWAVVIDTLALPEETMAMRDFVEQDLQVPVRYVINTHYHADHTWGSCFFPGALVISSATCRQLLAEYGPPALEKAKAENQGMFRQTKIMLPHLTFSKGQLGLKVGKKSLNLVALPGHSEDGIGVLIEEDRVLFSGDVLMPIPYLVDGDLDDMIASLKAINGMGLENIVPGHGDIILRGEIEATIAENLAYLNEVRKAVRLAGRRKYPLDLLEEIHVEDAGKSRVLLGGLAEDLHQRNLVALYKKTYGELPVGSELID